MFGWIIRRLRRPAADPEARNAESKRFLNELRQNELSIFAAMRRGEPVNAAPRQSLIATTRSQPLRPTPLRVEGVSPSVAPTKATGSTAVPDVDLATSLVIGTGTSSALVGAVAGGSIAGGLVGAALGAATEAAVTSPNDPQD
jgi:hypothetical protein